MTETSLVVQGIDEAFERFWNQYPAPRRVDRPATRRKFVAAINDGADWERIIEGLQGYVRNVDDVQYMPMSTTWLNQRRWETDPPPPRTAQGRNAGIAGNRDITYVLDNFGTQP